MELKDLNIKQYRSSNTKGFLYLLIPLVFATAGLILSIHAGNIWTWLAGQLLLGIFFFQCFILLHECGHYSYFRSSRLNRLLGHFFGFLSFIPFTSWVHIHNLHHRWTGWRDKDPTTEGTVAPKFSGFAKALVNVCWFTGLPLFTISYRLSNYWSPAKLRKHLPEKKLKAVWLNQAALLALYTALIVLFGDWLLKYMLLALLTGLAISDIFILSQHSHIATPLANGEEVKPLRYMEQLEYTRSIQIDPVISRLLFLNFNMHEWHHAFPGLPAYHLHKLPDHTPNQTPFARYLIRAKRMSGMKFIFTSKTKGERKI